MRILSYKSTRGNKKLGSFSDILLEGLAQDGGLAIPSNFETISESKLLDWSNLSYPDLASEILGYFIDDIDSISLRKLTHQAYNVRNFSTNEITPLTQLGKENNAEFFLLELSNGPTLAFKDIAMQMLGQLFEYVLQKRKSSLNILGATSGDTGSAAEYAMKEKSNISVFMLSPEGRMSSFQKAQMYSLLDKRIHNLVVQGTFDSCQDLVKLISSDLDFKKSLRITSSSKNLNKPSAFPCFHLPCFFKFPLSQ